MPHPYCDGDYTIFGVMPDWNPAEMIGTKPRPLALSLYKELITDYTWAYQRNNYGYRSVRSFPLLVTFLGHPYIDVRVDFNSFIPADLDADITRRLGSYYLRKLKKNPDSHDKIEFAIVLSCYFFNIDERLKELNREGFSVEDTRTIKESLLRLTNNIIKPEGSVFLNDIVKIGEIKRRQVSVIQSDISILEKIYWLCEDCKRFGTLPFAGLARAAFISIQMLRSLVETKIISRTDMDEFLSSLNTVAKQISRDRYCMARQDFLGRYGFLRPGTYDILSPRYDEAFDLYFGRSQSPPTVKAAFEFDAHSMVRLDKVLKESGICIGAKELITFIKEAIEGREYSKFVFTKSVSEILKLIKELGERYDLGAEDLSFVDIRTLIKLYATLDHRDLSEILSEEIRRNRKFYEVSKFIRLPHLIVDPNDVYEFELEKGAPNFVTAKRCCKETVREEAIFKQPLSDKIVFIKSADPGYDWIFSKSIAGMVTQYGGSNSHMAIRAAELKIPAVIGAGEKNFKLWSKAKVLDIDCENEQVTVIR